MLFFSLAFCCEVTLCGWQDIKIQLLTFCLTFQSLCAVPEVRLQLLHWVLCPGPHHGGGRVLRSDCPLPGGWLHSQVPLQEHHPGHRVSGLVVSLSAVTLSACLSAVSLLALSLLAAFLSAVSLLPLSAVSMSTLCWLCLCWLCLCWLCLCWPCLLALSISHVSVAVVCQPVS